MRKHSNWISERERERELAQSDFNQVFQKGEIKKNSQREKDKDEEREKNRKKKQRRQKVKGI